MKKLTLAVLSVVFWFNEAQAAPKTPRVTSDVSVASTSTSANKFGLGFSTYGGGVGFGTPAVSGMLQFGSQHSLQMLLAFGSSSPFQFSTGGIYRANVIGDHTGGFHIGGGFNLGTTAGAAAGTSFFLNIAPVVGFQFAWVVRRATFS